MLAEKTVPEHNPEPCLETLTRICPVDNMERTKQPDLQRRKKSKSRKMEPDNPKYPRDYTSKEMVRGGLEN